MFNPYFLACADEKPPLNYVNAEESENGFGKALHHFSSIISGRTRSTTLQT